MVAARQQTSIHDGILFDHADVSQIVYEARARHRKSHARRALRVSARHLGQLCTSRIKGDVTVSDCEAWCRNSSMDHCRFCKCRGCIACYELPPPPWTTANPIGLRKGCAEFGDEFCRRAARGMIGERALTRVSTNVSEVIDRVWSHWNYNNSRQWIDDIFSRVYGEVKFQAQTVDAEEGLTQAEWNSLRVSGDQGDRIKVV
eukprot:CAMPEP_0119336070 /NCGR_PEP_ID=MMETSP1333-20130426/91076_1 /TAXON_ID=418940 /ORGANISM="Scyphosphaera apsteinii, Strain RCC1455" /LENGTH=201 /DNA_ID=CAMNT_0007346793 /DNA_START=1 /DNA_END=606 /DNA_ORIENTATION=+